MSKYSEWKTGASTSCFGTLTLELFKTYSDAGISVMELSTSYDGYYKTLDFINRAHEYSDMAKEMGVWLRSIHLPFGFHLDISSSNEADRSFTMKTNLELIEAAHRANVSIAVVHPSSEPIDDSSREERMKYSIENLGILSEKCASLGMRLAVEDLPRTCLGHCSVEILRMLAQNPNLYVTFDTNHLLTEDNIDFINAVGSKIITLHVSDYDFIDERHIMPLDGKNNWKAIIKALENVSYDGAWVYEIHSGHSAAEIAMNKVTLGNL